MSAQNLPGEAGKGAVEVVFTLDREQQVTLSDGRVCTIPRGTVLRKPLAGEELIRRLLTDLTKAATCGNCPSGPFSRGLLRLYPSQNGADRECLRSLRL